MLRLRRFASFLALPLLFQLVLSVKAVACVDHAAGPNWSTAAAKSTMAGMDMPASQGANRRGQTDHSKRPPCDRPFGPGTCQPLAPCASGALVANEMAVLRLERIRTHAVLRVVLTPPSQTFPPELPPPRA